MWKYFKKIVRLSIQYIKFVGRRHYCALCGRYTRVFTPISTYPGQKTIDKYQIIAMGINPHYRCPWCNSSDKERLVWRYLNTQTDILSTNRSISVLHVAPEKNTQKRLRNRENIKYIAGDMFSGDDKYTPEHYGGAIYLDVTDMAQFASETFDVVICNHVFEHVIDDLKGMKEINRVLKDGGFAILQVPVSKIIKTTIEDSSAVTEIERTEKFGQSNHVRIYEEKDYISRLTRAGFFVEIIVCSSLFSKEESILCGVNQKESIYVCRKKK